MSEKDGSRMRASGCAFLVRAAGEESVFCPEKFSEEQELFGKTARDFVEKEVVPHVEELERQDSDKMVELLRKAGEVGLLMIDIPEAYDGLGVDKTTSMIVSESLSKYASFSVAYGAHTGIGSLPLIYFGTPEQKRRWLPKLATGEFLAAYALTEPGSGSDALAAKTTAVLTEDGEHYVLRGTKMWITNAGFADLFTVFCQVDGHKFSAFLVESTREGLSLGAEEKKMGIKGSSTRQVNLDDVKVPVENLLGEVGKGHKIAFNILNIGRFKLGVGVLGGSKYAMELATSYAAERRQFGQPIIEFGAIREKLAEMAARVFVLESMCYRVAGAMDERLSDLDPASEGHAVAVLEVIEEFAVEDSIMKVFGSETFDFVVDEALQIHGGYGFSAEFPIEQLYRDSRINRIFEGTNEINRMLVPGMILKRTMKGQLDLFSAMKKTDSEAEDHQPEEQMWAGDKVLSRAFFLSACAKRATLGMIQAAIQKHMADLREQQEILLGLADMIIDVYAIDSVIGRTLEVLRCRGLDAGVFHRQAMVVAIDRAYRDIHGSAERLLTNLCSEEDRERELLRLRETLPPAGIDVIESRRRLADLIAEKGKYPLGLG
jgi:alkylation response protein AidB-like acyl-CoA dehydrogenase